MPDEIDVPLEDVDEKVRELHAEQTARDAADEHAGEPKDWTRLVALCTAILAAMAAVAALESGLLINESLLQKNEQVGRLTKASDQWNYYQAEGLKSLIYQTAAQGQPVNSASARADLSESKHYLDKQAQIKADADAFDAQADADGDFSERILARHHIFAFSVSLFQISIALSAVAALTKRRRVWLVGLATGAIGAALLFYGFT